MMMGKIRWFSDAFGYGFIRDERGIDIFVHYSVIQAQGYKSVTQGQEVRYEVEHGPKGTRATVVIPERVGTSGNQAQAA
jgi:cold shock protein